MNRFTERSWTAIEVQIKSATRPLSQFESIGRMNPAERGFLAWVSNVSDSRALRDYLSESSGPCLRSESPHRDQSTCDQITIKRHEAVKAAEDKETTLWCGKGTHSHRWHDGKSARVWLTAPQRVLTDSCSKTEKCCALWGSPSSSLQLRRLWLNRWHFNLSLSAMSCCHHHKWMLPLSIESNHFLRREHCILIHAHSWHCQNEYWAAISSRPCEGRKEGGKKERSAE